MNTCKAALLACCALRILVWTPSSLNAADEKRPAVLFLGGVHSGYVVKPLVALGVEADIGTPGDLAKKLSSNAYNVVVVGTMNDAQRRAVADFLARGGGVLVCNPESYPREADFTKTCQWLEELGARERWEVLRDKDPKNVV
ncbi:MAG: hypothetical protein NTW87_01045, partial [Planctomycetota bacterium]|nr:hypothetical protein [Planctomycetota bacterium]